MEFYDGEMRREGGGDEKSMELMKPWKASDARNEKLGGTLSKLYNGHVYECATHAAQEP
jgi:hypothetical protein